MWRVALARKISVGEPMAGCPVQASLGRGFCFDCRRQQATSREHPKPSTPACDVCTCLPQPAYLIITTAQTTQEISFAEQLLCLTDFARKFFGKRILPEISCQRDDSSRSHGGWGVLRGRQKHHKSSTDQSRKYPGFFSIFARKRSERQNRKFRGRKMPAGMKILFVFIPHPIRPTFPRAILRRSPAVGRIPLHLLIRRTHEKGVILPQHIVQAR
jgi:hypothetical protein